MEGLGRDGSRIFGHAPELADVMTIIAFLLLLAEKKELQRDFESSEARARQLMADLELDHEQQDLILGLEHANGGHRQVSGTEALEAAIARELRETQAELPNGVAVHAPLIINRPAFINRNP